MHLSSLLCRSLLGGVLLLTSYWLASAQTPGSLDTWFFSGHAQFANFTVDRTVTQPDGKIIINGNFTSYGWISRNYIARLNANGSLDTSFSGGTTTDNFINSIALQPDGKILIAGLFTNYEWTNRNYIARLNANGSLDTSFSGGTMADNEIYSIALQPDGKILIAGLFTSYGWTNRNYIARLNANGSLDTSFSGGTMFDNEVAYIALQPDGKILVNGLFTSYNWVTRNGLARINSDGSLDTGFSDGDMDDSTIKSIALQPDGKILIGGYFTIYNWEVRNRLARLNANGSLDTSFSGGTMAMNVINSIALQPDGKIVIGGLFTSYNWVTRNRLARINPNGSLDTGFSGGTMADNDIHSIALQPDGKILIGGLFTSYNNIVRFFLAKINTDWSLDTSFYDRTMANNIITSTAIQSDGKILIGGLFTSYNGITHNRLARINPDGSLDTSFSGGTMADNTINAMALQPDGKILVGGAFTSYNGVTRNRLARINPDGSLDTSFSGGSMAMGGDISAIAIQSDGKVLIGGAFTTYNGVTRNRLARINPDGSLDTSFSWGSMANLIINAMALQSDGKIVIGGAFTTYNGVTRNRLARINPNGSLDTSFSGGSMANSAVNALSVQSDGKIIIGGWFTSYNWITRNRLARINPNGSLDTSFSGGSMANLIINAMALQSDGKILVGGLFTSYNGVTRNSLARINADGSLDTSFSGRTMAGGTMAGTNIYSITLQPDGKAIIGGDFKTYGEDTRFNLARIDWGIIECLNGIWTITFSSFGFCLQSAGQTEQVSLFDVSTNTPIIGRIINVANLFKVIRAPYRVAPTATSSTAWSISYLWIPLSVPALSAESSGDVYITPFKPLEIGTGGTILPIYE